MNQYRSVSSTLCKTTTSQCPTTGWQMQPNVSFNGPSSSGSNCTYTPKCTNGGTLYNGDAVSNGATITCTLGGTGSTACTTDNLGTMFRPYFCPVSVTCPPEGTFGNLANGRIEEPTKPNVSTCQYQLSCNTNYTLNGYNPIECSGDTCNTNYLSSQLQQRSCQQDFKCPDASVPGGYGSILNTQTGNKCDYTLKCDTGYAYPNGTATHTCTGSACTTGTNSVTTWASGLECKAKVTCPSSKIVTHGQITMESIENGTACNYTINCNAPAYICNTANLADQCTNGFRCETAEACNTFLNMTRGVEACVFECPSKEYVKSKIPHLDYIGRVTSGTQPNCTYGYATCASCYTKTSGSASSVKCNDEGEQCNETGANAWYTGIVCEWVGGDGCGPDR